MKLVNFNDVKVNDYIVLYGPNGEEIHGQITAERIDRNTVPEGKYVYDFRESGDGDIASIEKKNVIVNFFGSFICDKEIDFCETDYIDLGSKDTKWDYSYE